MKADQIVRHDTLPDMPSATNDDHDERYRLTHVGVITDDYNASVQEHIQCNVSGGDFFVLLPETPESGSVIVVQNATIEPTANVLEIRTQGSDTIAIESGPTSLYTTLLLETVEFNYHLDDNVWEVTHTAPPSNFALGFPGISTQTPLSAGDYTFDLDARTLTIVPPLGYIDVFVDGNGKVSKFRKDGNILFPAWTNTSGIWFFYFDTTGTPVTTQTPWVTDDFSEIATVQRFFWNSLESGDARIQSSGFEAHPNDIPADTHAHFHLGGTIWSNGLEIATNAIDSGSPAGDGSNTVVALTAGTIIDDNLRHDVENSTGGGLFQQDLGDTTPATLDNTNSGVFPILYLTGDAGIVGTYDATRFPFPFGNNTANTPDYITVDGVFTEIPNNSYFSVFIWAIGDSRTGRFATVSTSPEIWTSVGLGALAVAEAYNWESITADIVLLADEEIRPLYRLIYERSNTYDDVDAKYSALRVVTDLRKAEVTASTAAAGSTPATSVTVAPVGDISSTNAQSAFQELDAEKLALSGGTMTGNLDMGFNDIVNPDNIDGGVDPAAVIEIGNVQAYYQFSDSDGIGTLDDSVNSNDLVISAGTPAYCDRGLRVDSVSGLIIASKGWDSENTQYLVGSSYKGPLSPTGGDSYSISFLIKVGPLAIANDVMLAWGNGAAAGQFCNVRINSGGVGTLGGIQIIFGNGNTSSVTAINDGEWHHIVIVFPDHAGGPFYGFNTDVAAGSPHYQVDPDYIKIYRDGIDDTATSILGDYNNTNAARQFIPTTSAANFTVGSDVTGTFTIDACFDEVAVFFDAAGPDGELTPAQIPNIFNRQKETYIGGTTGFDLENLDTPINTSKDITAGGDVNIGGALNHDGLTVGFYGESPITQQDVPDLDTLLTVLDNMGLIHDTSP